VCKAHQQADANDQQPIDQDIPPHDAVAGDRCSTVMEKEVVITDVQFPDAMQLMFCPFCLQPKLGIPSRKKTVYYFDFVQKVLMELNGH